MKLAIMAYIRFGLQADITFLSRLWSPWCEKNKAPLSLKRNKVCLQSTYKFLIIQPTWDTNTPGNSKLCSVTHSLNTRVTYYMYWQKWPLCPLPWKIKAKKQANHLQRKKQLLFCICFRGITKLNINITFLQYTPEHTKP